MKHKTMKKIIYIIYLSFIFLTFSFFLFPFSFIYAQEDTIFKYETGANRDPFIPLVTKDGKLTITYGTLNSINDVILEGILYDPSGESVVIMNDLVLKEGGRAGGIEVKKIEEDRVILFFEGKDYTFKLKE